MRGIYKFLIPHYLYPTPGKQYYIKYKIASNRGVQSWGEYKRSPKKLIYHNKLKRYRTLIALAIIMATRSTR